MKKILGYVLSIFSIMLFLSLVLCMILIKKEFMKYLLLIISNSSVVIFFLGITLIRNTERTQHEK